jgi:hypothetical protein
MEVFSRIFSSLTNAKFPGGVVGRNLYSAVCVCLGLAALAFAARPYPWILVLIVVAIVGVYWRGSSRADKFATANPELATLEGSEITRAIRVLQNYASKNRPEIPAAQDVKTLESGSTGETLDMEQLEQVQNDPENQ